MTITLPGRWPLVLKPGLIGLLAALSLCGAVLIAGGRSRQSGQAWVTWQEAVIAGALALAALVVHEVGHALAAKATGRTVLRLEFGLAGGAVTSGDTTPWRRVVAIACGPLLELVFGLLLWSFAGGGENAVGAAGLMAIINGVGNLLPFHKSLDGYRLLTFLRLAIRGNAPLGCVPEGPCPACTGKKTAPVAAPVQEPVMV